MKALMGCLALAVALAGTAAADVKPKEPEKGPDSEGSGSEMPDEARQQNPLPGIIEKMKEVERRLAETDARRWTREEEQRIIEALGLERGVIEALEKLIDEVESRPPSGGGGSASESQQQRSRSRERQRSQPKERQGGGQDKPIDPQAEKSQAERERAQRNQAENDRRSEGKPEGAEYKLDPKRAPQPGETWGSLPPRQAREVMEAKRREPPPQWRKQIEDYFRKLAEPRKP